MNQNLYNELLQILSEDQIKIEEPMKNHTTFRVGGPADLFVTPRTAGEVRRTVALCTDKGAEYFILGNGSNLLVSDQGYRGVVIQIYKEMNQIETEGEIIRAQAGALLSAIACRALEHGLAGFEFASGIPGTLGGACVMNAGAYGGEMKDVLKSVTVLIPGDGICVIPGEELEMGYRTSRIAREGDIVLEAEIRLSRGNQNEIRAQMAELKEQRISKQPLEYPSAGSTFKRPEGYFAGKLIQDAGLRGFQVGGAQVSEKHCGFVINKDHATAADIAELMRQVSARVEEQFGVKLEPEVKRLGEFLR